MTKQVTPAELALRLHDKRTSTLTLQLEEDEQGSPAMLDGCYRTQGRMFEFESLEVRNAIVARARFEALDEKWTESVEPLFDAAYDLWRKEIGHADYASGRLLALAADHIDVVLAAARRMHAGMDVFHQLYLLQAALPHLRTLDVHSLLELCETKHEKTKNDMAGGLFHGALEQWLAQHPGTAKALHELAVTSAIPSHQSLICNAVVALSKSEFAKAIELAMEDARNGRPEVAATGVWALGRLLLDSNDKCLTEKLENSIAEYLGAEEQSVRQQALQAACGAMHKVRVFDQAVMALAQVGDQHALCAVADTLFRHWKDISEQTDLSPWLATLALLDAGNAFAMTAVDGVFSELLEAAKYEDTIIGTLQAWVLHHSPATWRDNSLGKSFPGTVAALRSIPQLWSRFLTTWLLGESKALPAAIAGLISFSFDDDVEMRFDTSIIDDLDAEGLLFLVRRMLGFFIDAKVLLSFTYSMLESKDARTRVYPLVRELIVGEIGYDYPDTTVTSLDRKIAESEDENKAFLEEVLVRLKAVISAERALPRLKELLPPAQLRRHYARARAEQMSSALRKARKESILYAIANKISVKAGNGTFSHGPGGYGQVAPMGSISHSIELPRREVLDPIGNDIRMRQFRLVTRGEQ